MQKLVEYKIISGRVVEVRRSWMPMGRGQKKPRAGRIAGNTSEKKIAANERAAVERLARILNCNIERGWIFVTLKYDDAHLPADMDGLKKSAKKFLKKLRTAFKAEHGRTLRYITVNATRSTKHGGPARYHHHIVMEAVSADLIRSLWHGGGSVICEDIDNRADHTALAVYLSRNTERAERGERSWETSRGNLAKPIFTEPEEVNSIDGIAALPGSTVAAMSRTETEDGQAQSSYIRCVLPEKPEVRGGRVILPKTRKRGGKLRI